MWRKKKKKNHGRETKKKETGENYDSVLNGGRSFRAHKVHGTKCTKYKVPTQQKETKEEKEITHIEEKNLPAWNELRGDALCALGREGDSDCSTTNTAA